MEKYTDKKSLAVAFLGHVLERYELALYGYFATLLSPIFFPSEGIIGLISSMGAFAAGYLMRPLGGLFFGFLGDLYGRKKAFSISVFFVAIPTLIIGFLPSYSEIGILAPIVIVGCRLMQGFCGGGEFSGVGIYFGEYVPSNKNGFYAGIVCSGGQIGALLATFLGALLTSPLAPEYGWRLPFIVGSFASLIIYYLRRSMAETPAFKKSYQEGVNNNVPIRETFKKYKRNLLCLVGIGGCGHMFLYIPLLYMNVLYLTVLKLPHYSIMFINMACLTFWMFGALVMGLLADWIGIRKLMSFAAFIGALSAVPIFWFLEHNPFIGSYILAQIIFSVIGVAFVAPISSLFVLSFPVRQRYRGVGFSICLGQALLGGTTPMIATLLTELTGNFKAPAFYIICVCFVGYAAIRLLKEVCESQAVDFAKDNISIENRLRPQVA